jgi:hypothetical protein
MLFIRCSPEYSAIALYTWKHGHESTQVIQRVLDFRF